MHIAAHKNSHTLGMVGGMHQLTWTIGKKLLAIGVLAVVGIGVIASSSILGFENLKGVVEKTSQRQEQLRTVEAMRRTTLDVMLAAMDSIIDKDEGKVQPERAEVISDGIAFLKEAAAPLTELADTDEERRLAAIVSEDILQLEDGLKNKLFTAIENRADQAAFAEIDNVLDAYGEGLNEKLGLIAESVNAEMQEATQHQNTTMDNIQKIVLGALSLTLLVLLPCLYLVTRGITNPIARLTSVMNGLASGNLDLSIPATDRRDEIGEMARTVETFKTNAQKVKQLEQEQAESEKRAAEKQAQDRAELARNFEDTVNSVIGEVSQAADEMGGTARDMTASSEQTLEQSARVSTASEQITTNIQTVSSATQELSSSIQEIANQVTRTTTMATDAVSQAQETNQAIAGLANSAEQIDDIVSLISDIAEQTNLLALNATIEAARAGDAGKGFAVVASEVKSLANQTAQATENISRQVSAIQNETGSAVEAIQVISKTIEDISEVVTSIAAAVEEQNSATDEIARNVQQVATGTQEVNSNVTQVNQAAEKAGGSSTKVLHSADAVSKQIASLQQEVERFLQQLRTG